MLNCRSSLPSTCGFTLAEMSIVLVIIGALLGAVIGGQHLIHSMKLKKVTEDLQTYEAAILGFADRYKALPGDMATATTYWGEVSNAAECTTPTSTTGGNDVGVGTGTQTCNGNGDDSIGDYDTTQLRHEMFRAWQHLALSGFIGDIYTGYRGADASKMEHNVGENAPAGSFAKSGWSIMHIDNYTGDSESDELWFNRDFGNVLVYGGERSDGPTLDPALTPQELWGIDTKIDDGSPVTGKVSAVLEDAGGDPQTDCTSANGDSSVLTATYDSSVGTVSCAFYYTLPQEVRGRTAACSDC